MTVSIFLMTMLPALLVAAAMFDLTTFTIPNVLPLAMFLLFGALMLVMTLDDNPVSLSHTLLHLAAGGLGLAVAIALFAAGWVGGGDAKLFAMSCLWLGWDELFHYAILASLLGGALTLGLVVLRRIPLPSALTAQPWLARLADPASGVPYGVALAIAALAILPDTELFRLAATS